MPVLKVKKMQLWLEKSIADKQIVNIENIWEHLTLSKHEIKNALNLLQNSNQKIISIDDQQIQQKLKIMLVELSIFTKLAKQRLDKDTSASVKLTTQKQSDASFQSFLKTTKEVKSELEKKTQHHISLFKRIQWIQAITIGLLGILITWLLQRHARSVYKIRETEDRLSQSQSIAHIGTWKLDLLENKLWCSEEIYNIFEIDAKVFKPSYEAFLDQIHPEDRNRVQLAYEKSLENKTAYDITHRLRFKNNRIKYVIEHCQTFYDEEGNPLHSIGSVQDITNRMNTEKALRHSQKMSALGQLTGGIAHDFNNLLSIILGNIELLKLDNLNDDRISKRIHNIEESSNRAAKLIKQLLGFSRHQSTESSNVDINDSIKQMGELINESLSPQIDWEYSLADELWLTNINNSDFQNSLLNLVINARDAILDQGCIAIETCNKTLDKQYCSLNPGAISGDYVQLSVSDTGSGISSDTQQHLFEPFFSTKDSNKGTGLGLSMVYGFVQRSRGHIKVYSELGVGTTFRLYLPRANSNSDSTVEDSDKKIQKGNETILVVDDESKLLETTKLLLERQGYKVFTATNGDQALKILAKNLDIDLLFSDVVMPNNMNGYELAEKSKILYPNLKILLTSGYTKKVITLDNHKWANDEILGKPYNQLELSQRIRQILDD